MIPSPVYHVFPSIASGIIWFFPIFSYHKLLPTFLNPFVIACDVLKQIGFSGRYFKCFFFFLPYSNPIWRAWCSIGHLEKCSSLGLQTVLWALIWFSPLTHPWAGHNLARLNVRITSRVHKLACSQTSALCCSTFSIFYNVKCPAPSPQK